MFVIVLGFLNRVPVSAVKLITDPKTQRPKGFGFITFQSEDDAQKALKTMDGRVPVPFDLIYAL